MGFFGNLKYGDSSQRQFVPLPLDRLVEVGQNIQQRYDIASQGINQLELFVASVNVDDTDRIHIKNRLDEFHKDLDPFLDEGNLWDAYNVISNHAVKFQTDDLIKKSIYSKALYDEFVKKISDDITISDATKSYLLAKGKSTKTGAIYKDDKGNYHNVFSPPNYVPTQDYSKLALDIAKEIVKSPNAKPDIKRQAGLIINQETELVEEGRISDAAINFLLGTPLGRASLEQDRLVAGYQLGLVTFNNGKDVIEPHTFSSICEKFNVPVPKTLEEAMLNPLFAEIGVIKLRPNLNPETNELMKKSNIPNGDEGILYEINHKVLKELGLTEKDLYNTNKPPSSKITKVIMANYGSNNFNSAIEAVKALAYQKTTQTVTIDEIYLKNMEYLHKRQEEMSQYFTNELPGMYKPDGDFSIYNLAHESNELVNSNKGLYELRQVFSSLPNLYFNNDGTINWVKSRNTDGTPLTDRQKRVLDKYVTANNYDALKAVNIKVNQNHTIISAAVKEYLSTPKGIKFKEKMLNKYPNWVADKLETWIDFLYQGEQSNPNRGGFFNTMSDISGMTAKFFSAIDPSRLLGYPSLISQSFVTTEFAYDMSNFGKDVSKYAKENGVHCTNNIVVSNTSPGADKSFVNTLLKGMPDATTIGGKYTFRELDSKYMNDDYYMDVMNDKNTGAIILAFTPKKENTADKGVTVYLNPPEESKNRYYKNIVTETWYGYTQNPNDLNYNDIDMTQNFDDVNIDAVKRVMEDHQLWVAKNSTINNSYGESKEKFMNGYANDFTISYPYHRGDEIRIIDYITKVVPVYNNGKLVKDTYSFAVRKSDGTYQTIPNIVYNENDINSKLNAFEGLNLYLFKTTYRKK